MFVAPNKCDHCVIQNGQWAIPHSTFNPVRQRACARACNESGSHYQLGVTWAFFWPIKFANRTGSTCHIIPITTKIEIIKKERNQSKKNKSGKFPMLERNLNLCQPVLFDTTIKWPKEKRANSHQYMAPADFELNLKVFVCAWRRRVTINSLE